MQNELNKYMSAMQREMGGSAFLSFSGPDMTKIGTDLSVSIGFVMNQKTGKVGVMPPQDLLCFSDLVTNITIGYNL